jgi:hypothetical protein
MSPELLRLLMAVVGVAALVATHFAPDAREVLLAAGAWLIGVAMKAPGHGGPPPPPAAPTLTAMTLGLALAGCGAAQPAPPCDSATLVGIVAECSLRVRAECAADGPCPAEDECRKRLRERKARCWKS